MYLYLILLLLAIGYSINEDFSNNIKILNKNELQEILMNNHDNYYDRFTNLDLSVRNVKSIQEYKNKIFNSPITIEDKLKNIIYKQCNLIDSIFKDYKSVGFDGEKASKINWTIGIIDDKEYEFGLPHTRGNVIIIPRYLITIPRLFNTLIHEKIHVYQKMYPDDIDVYLKNYNFKKINNINRQYVRANPDITTDLYTDKQNKLLICQYNSNPQNISDVTIYPINEDKYEHPYEYMAYTLEKEISKNI